VNCALRFHLFWNLGTGPIGPGYYFPLQPDQVNRLARGRTRLYSPSKGALDYNCRSFGFLAVLASARRYSQAGMITVVDPAPQIVA
jgi:hypothetical protein